MKVKTLLLIVFVLGLSLINLYIKWLNTKIVPVTIELPLCDSKNSVQFSVQNLYPGKHAIGIFFKDKVDNSVNDLEKKLRFRCKIFDEEKNIIIFDKNFDIQKMRPSGWGTKYIPEVDVGFYNFPTSDDDIEYFFFSKYSVNYSVQVELLEASENLCAFSPVLGLFCTDIDKGYFGGEYVIYNFFYLIFWIAVGVTYSLAKIIIWR